jgi:hypothetical protein
MALVMFGANPKRNPQDCDNERSVSMLDGTVILAQCCPEITLLLLQHGADPNARHPHDYPTISNAATGGSAIKTLLLIAYGATMPYTPLYQHHPLYIAFRECAVKKDIDMNGIAWVVLKYTHGMINAAPEAAPEAAECAGGAPETAECAGGAIVPMETDAGAAPTVAAPMAAAGGAAASTSGCTFGAETKESNKVIVASDQSELYNKFMRKIYRRIPKFITIEYADAICCLV